MNSKLKTALVIAIAILATLGICALSLWMGPEVGDETSQPTQENSAISTESTTNKEVENDEQTETTTTVSTQKAEVSVPTKPSATENQSTTNSKVTTTTQNKTTFKPITTTTTTKTEITNSDTVFDTYLSFVSNIQSGVYSLAKEPNSLETLNTTCSCNIQFYGDFKDGLVKMTINGKQHQHKWSSNSIAVSDVNADAYYAKSNQSVSGSMSGISGNEIGNSLNGNNSVSGENNDTTSGTQALPANDSQTLYACKECGFVKGLNFIFIHLPQATHGHGWSWKNQPASPDTDVHTWKCGCTLLGDYYQGNFEIIITGIMSDGVNDIPLAHSHSWHQEKPKATTTKANSGGNSGVVGGGSTGVPPCQTCSFRRWTSSDGFQRTIQFKCPKTGQLHQIIANG